MSKECKSIRISSVGIGQKGGSVLIKEEIGSGTKPLKWSGKKAFYSCGIYGKQFVLALV